LPSITSLLAPGATTSWIIRIDGDNSDDRVTAHIEHNDQTIFHDDSVVVTRTDGKGNVERETFRLFGKWPLVGYWPTFEHIEFYAGNGTNRFDNQTYIRSRAYGGNGADSFYGSSPSDGPFYTSGSDSLYGYGGDDVLDGRGGDDVLQGDSILETGNDELRGGAGNDYLYGGLGHDLLYGQAGDDFLSDLVISGAYSSEGGNDWLYGGAGADRLFGYSGWDRLYGGDGDDELDGGQDGQADVLWGGSGADKFKAEWYAQSVSGSLGVKKNRDQPQDFAAGDHIVSPPLIPFNP
jgi:Ca2+-binding RTX toxin-like protein